MVSEETIHAFIAATKLRAKAYAFFFEEISGELGLAKTMELCSRVTYRLGQDKAAGIPEASRESARMIAEAFVADPVGSTVFCQQIISADENEAIIEMKRCPLVEMWQTMDIGEEMLCRLCDFAHRIDYGTIEGVGFKLEFSGRIACGNDSCLLRVYR